MQLNIMKNEYEMFREETNLKISALALAQNKILFFMQLCHIHSNCIYLFY